MPLKKVQSSQIQENELTHTEIEPPKQTPGTPESVPTPAKSTLHLPQTEPTTTTSDLHTTPIPPVRHSTRPKKPLAWHKD